MTQYSGKIIRKNPVTPTQQSASGVWTTADAAAAVKNNNWPVAGVPNPISRSVRLRSSASAYFNRTPSASSRTTWTWAAWVKRGKLGSAQVLFSAGTGTAEFRLTFTSSDTIEIYEYTSPSYNWQKITTAVYRDPSAWYQIQLVYDTTNGTAADRVKLYVNGVQVTSFGTNTNPTSSFSGYVNSAVAHGIGSFSTGANYLDGYLTEINFIDGQALTPSSFGTTDSTTGAWVPMPYTGTYGTNGFYLNFKDNTSTTTIGYDYSGNSNNWTANNISLTAGVTYDSMVDVPTLWMPYNTAGDTGALVRGNYCVLNAAIRPYSTTGNIVDGNLRVTNTAGTNITGSAWSTIPITSGKYYAECTVTTVGNYPGSNDSVGVSSSTIYAGLGTSTAPLRDVGYTYANNGQKVLNGSFSAYGASYTSGDVIGIALDADAGSITFYKNNVSQGVAFTGMSYVGGYIFGSSLSNNGVHNWNFGQRPFTYTPPTGFKTLNTFNLPAPTINNGASYMAATTYTGTGSAMSVSNAVNNVSFQPDWVWIKQRNNAANHVLADAIRGIDKYVFSNLTNAEATATAGTGITAFNSNGFSLGTETSTVGSVNAAGGTGTYVAWQWNAGGSTVTNTSGSISSQVRASTTAGFSVVTYTGNGTNGATIGHGLGVAPSMMIIKTRSAVNSWVVYHQSLGNTKAIYLNLTGAADTNASFWNNTSPASSVFTVGTDTICNQNGTTYVAYCFAAVAGYSAFGSYTGNGSADGPFVYLGFRPRYLLIKSAVVAGGTWVVFDSARSTYNVTGEKLAPNTADLENSGATGIAGGVDFLSNGFKIRLSWGDINTSNTLIYAAFAENPFKNSNAR